ncbi:MAG: aminotransferase class V-fold PLP-dependent enzyme [Verrucomicrobiota bacterium JB023]|nr:aminotransferase class V-fold PLP-dependent enzyme [Verrucomicrobiota bacterium JB023]
MIYLDNNATTAVHPEVLEAMLPFLKDNFLNPSSGYRAAKPVKAALQKAREQVAALINAEPDEIIFTSCGTESNNTALKSLARLVGRKNSLVVTSAIEHSAVLRPIEAMAAVGFETLTLGVSEDGRFDLEEAERQLDTQAGGKALFASLMWSNNETGVNQPIEEAVTLLKQHGAAVHSDAIQAVGKIPVDVRAVPVDMLSLSGHKLHAPKGVGALFLRKGFRLEPLLRGGGQEFGHRSGTENVPYIVGLGQACELAMTDHSTGIAVLRDHLEQRLVSEIDGVHLNGSRTHRAPNICHVSFDHCEGAGLLILLDEAGVQVSTGSACMTGKQQPSHVQKAMGFTDERAKSSLRISLSRFTTREEIDRAAEAIAKAVKKLRAIQSPLTGPVQIYS